MKNSDSNYVNQHWLSRAGRVNEIEEAHEATFEELKKNDTRTIELVGEDDDNEDEARREGRTAQRMTDSRGILIEEATLLP